MGIFGSSPSRYLLQSTSSSRNKFLQIRRGTVLPLNRPPLFPYLLNHFGVHFTDEQLFSGLHVERATHAPVRQDCLEDCRARYNDALPGAKFQH